LQLKDELERRARLGKFYQFIKKYVNGKGTGRQDERGQKDSRSGNRDPEGRPNNKVGEGKETNNIHRAPYNSRNRWCVRRGHEQRTETL